MSEPTKVCGHCKKERFLWQFSNDKGKPDGLSRDCKECHNAANKKYRKKHHVDEAGKVRARKLDKWRGGFA